MCFALMFHAQCINRLVCVRIVAEEHIEGINMSVVAHRHVHAPEEVARTTCRS